jgi:hypothetical protein
VRPDWSGHIEVHGTPTILHGYLTQDTRPDAAHLVIRKQHIGPVSNDLGFRKCPDGTIEALIGEYDQRHGSGQAWLNTVAQHYACGVAEKQVARLGATLSKTVKSDGSWRLVLTKPERKVSQTGGTREWQIRRSP